MKRMKFRFLACVAMVLVFVFLVETPVSAYSDIDVTQYLVSTSSSGSTTVKEYYYPSGDTSCYKISYADSDYVTHTVKKGYGDWAEYTLSEDSEATYLNFAPTTKYEYCGDVDEAFLLSSFDPDTTTSLQVDFRISLFCSEGFSGALNAHFYTDLNNGYDAIKVTIPVTIEAGTWIDVSVALDVLDYYSLYQISSLRPIVSVSFGKLKSGTTIGVSFGPPSDSDQLGPGVRFRHESARIQESPVFTNNLSTSTVTYLVGKSPSALSVNASVSDGGTITYQWYKTSSRSATGSLISGATGKTYYPDTTVESESYYYCVATSTLDGETKSTKSNVAHVAVVKQPVAPVIYSDLHSGNLEYYQGETAEPLFFGVYAPDGGTLSYQWYEGDLVYGDPQPISGAIYSSYTPPTSVVGTYYYYCVATNSKGSYKESITSREGKIQVVEPPDPAVAPVITSDLPTDPITYKEGKAASALRIGAESPDGGVLSYQWYQVVDGVSELLPGENSASFTPDTVNVGTFGYYCVVTNTVLNTSATATSSTATVVIEPDRTDSLLDSIVGGVSDIIDGIMNLPTLIIDGIKSLFVPDAETMAAYQDKWSALLSQRFGAIYESIALIDEFGQSISEQSKKGIVTFPEVSLNLAGATWTFGGWDVDVVPDGFDALISALKTAINIVCSFAFVNGLRRRFEGIIGGA